MLSYNQTHLRSLHVHVALICISFLFAKTSLSQDLEPRRWTSLPLGIHIVGAGYGHTSGEIFFDPVLQAKDASLKANTFLLQYVRPFKLGDKLARVDISIPYRIANWDGLLEGVPTSIDRNGFADPRIRLSVNFIGAQAMGKEEFYEYIASHPVSTTVGVSLAVVLPLGQYFEDKLLNLGQNQFVLRPQVGMVHNWNQWSFELSTSLFVFTNNNNFFDGKERRQKPVFALQSHLIKRFKSRLWISASVGFGSGGRSLVNSLSSDDQREDRLGAISIGSPISKKQSVKFAYIYSGTQNNIGNTTNSYVLGWSLLL